MVQNQGGINNERKEVWKIISRESEAQDHELNAE